MLEDICDIALSIHFAKSQDNESSDLHKSQNKNNSNFQKFKCFKCYGTEMKYCPECRGAQLIQFQHPLAKLLNSILQKKLNLDKDKQAKQGQQLEEVYPIKQQQQDTDQRKLLCSFCHSDCEQIFYYCPVCPLLHICQFCQKKNISHEHSILRSKLTSTCKIEFIVTDSVKKCNNCSKEIENCYSICKTCQERGANFWVCDACSDNKTYIHSSNHILQTVMDYNYDDQCDNHIETISQQLQNYQESLEQDHIRIEETQNLYFQEQIKNHFLVKKNSSIMDYVESAQHQDLPSLLLSNKSDDNPKKNEYVSRVRFQFDQNLFSSCQFTAENKQNTKKILCPPKVNFQDRFSYSRSQTSHSHYKQNYQREQNCQFSFSGYRCDICEVEPIKNVRYHCTSCQDFDVCQKCFETCLKTHDHITFDKIDHEEMRQKAMNKIFQQRDCNLKGSVNLVHRKGNRSKTVRFSSINT